MTQHFTIDNFNQEVIEASNEKPVLIDFYADWCGPCRMMAPVLNEFSDHIGDQAIVGKINTEQSPELAHKYGVMSIPTLIIIRNGEEVERLVGVHNVGSLDQIIKEHL